MKKHYLKRITKLSLLCALAMASCKNDDDANNTTLSSQQVVTNKIQNENIATATLSSFIDTYAKIAAANYNDAYVTAQEMQTEINAFVANPSTTTLESARSAWLHARDFYGQTEAFREANGPIDNDDLLATEGQLNAWPLDEGHIDYVSGDRGAKLQKGLIGDPSFVITEENIIAKNEDGGEKNISTGWHAIEFLLWGQDLNYDPETRTTTNFAAAGERPFTDYTTEEHASRRKDYLITVTNILVKDLKDLNDTWATGGNYRTTFESLDENVVLTNILNGIGFISNGEVALERLDPAIDEGQENEHSCFSDNTNQDMWANVNGIHNVIAGSYKRASGTTVSGTSLIALVVNIGEDIDLAADLAVKADTTLEKLNQMLALNKTFDAIIHEESLGGNGPAGQLSSALKSQGISISEAAKALGVSITIN